MSKSSSGSSDWGRPSPKIPDLLLVIHTSHRAHFTSESSEILKKLLLQGINT